MSLSAICNYFKLRPLPIGDNLSRAVISCLPLIGNVMFEYNCSRINEREVPKMLDMHGDISKEEKAQARLKRLQAGTITYLKWARISHVSLSLIVSVIVYITKPTFKIALGVSAAPLVFAFSWELLRARVLCKKNYLDQNPATARS